MRIFIDNLDVHCEVNGENINELEGRFVNVYKRADGTLISGSKHFASENDARRNQRARNGATHVGIVSLTAYAQYLRGTVDQMKNDAKAYVIHSADSWLAQQCNVQVIMSKLSKVEHTEDELPKKIVKKKIVKKPVKLVKKPAKKVKKPTKKTVKKVSKKPVAI